MHRNSRRGGALAGALLAIVMLGVLGIVALVGTGLYVADNIRVTDTDSRSATIETPFGAIRVRDNDRFGPEDVGVPIYPGATRDRHCRKIASFRLDFGDTHKAFEVSAATYHSRDSVERVTEFYRDRLPHWLISQKENGGLQFSLTKHGYRRMVAICDDDGETRIALASVGEPESN